MMSPSTGPLLRHWSSHSIDGSSTEATRELTCLWSRPAFGASGKVNKGGREAGDGNGPEGSQFAAHGARHTRRVRELSCPEDHPEPADRCTDLNPGPRA